MNRRGFLAVLAGLPFVGKLFPQGQSFEADASRYLKPRPYRYQSFTPLPEVKWRPLNGKDIAEDLERLQRVATLDRLDMTCLDCGDSTVIYIPSETFRTGILKIQKFVCVDCSIKRLEH